MSEQAVPVELWAVAGAAEIEVTSPAEQESLVRIRTLCPPDFLRYLWEEDDVLVNFGRGYVRFQRRSFVAALAEVLPDLLQATLAREKSKGPEPGLTTPPPAWERSAGQKKVGGGGPSTYTEPVASGRRDSHPKT